MSSSEQALRVAVLGAGTVGGPVVRALLQRADRLTPFDGSTLTLTAVADKFTERVIAGGVPATLVTDAPAHVVAADDNDVIVELVGGDEPAHTLIAAALAAGKSVVTANKHVVAHHGPEFEALARANGGSLRFEAAVGGGTPVLTPIAQDLAANAISQVRGIVNGTTNFILTAMRENGAAYADVLAEAQGRGYAEADPRGDVEGDDAVNKIVILARLAFGAWIAPQDVRTAPPTVSGSAGRRGITGVTADEVAGAAALGLTLRLIARTERGADGRPVASVLPSAVARFSPLGMTDWVLNRIEVTAAPVGTVAFEGPGAGGDATSSAVLADLMAIARGHASTWGGSPPATAAPAPAADSEAADALEGARSWFAFLPSVSAEASGGADIAGVQAVNGGAAVRTVVLTLAGARTALAGLAPGNDATLYPVAE